MAELPQLENVEVNKREAVRLLASTIQGLQCKEYRRDKIAELVSDRGVTIKATTLKSYLHRVKPRAKASGMTNRRREVAAGETATEQLRNGRENFEATPPSASQATDGAQEIATKERGLVAAASPEEEVGTTSKVSPRTTQPAAPRNRPNDEAGTPELTSKKQARKGVDNFEATPPSLPQATNRLKAGGTKEEEPVAAVSPTEDAGATRKVVPRPTQAIPARTRPNDEAGTPEPTLRGRRGDNSGTGEAMLAAPPNHQPVDGARARASANPPPSRATPVTRPVDIASATFLPREDSDGT